MADTIEKTEKSKTNPNPNPEEPGEIEIRPGQVWRDYKGTHYRVHSFPDTLGGAHTTKCVCFVLLNEYNIDEKKVVNTNNFCCTSLYSLLETIPVANTLMDGNRQWFRCKVAPAFVYVCDS